MKTQMIIGLLLVTMVFPFQVGAQTTKPELNEQLWEAARKGDAAAVTALLDRGADVNAKFRYGTTALFKASERGNAEVVSVLLARGADVNVKDTFYGATALTWAIQNDHLDIVRALLDKGAESVDDVLLEGARQKKLPLIRVALERGGAKPATLTTALAAVTAGEDKNEEIVELLKKAGATPPPEVDAATLHSYVGKYRSDGAPEVTITSKDGKLFSTRAGQQTLALMAVDQLTFKPVAFDGAMLTFKVEGGKVTGYELKQGATTTLLKRIDEVKTQ